MKISTAIIVSLLFLNASAQKASLKENIIIITIDGFRWQEVFTGADSAFIYNQNFVKDTQLMAQQFWDKDEEVRKQKLMPFFWNVIARRGQLYGNRYFDNKVNVSNIYKISYPGYSEIFTGHTTLKFNPNLPVENKSTNILEYLNTQEGYNGKVVAFSSWNVFPFILNENRSKFPVNSGYEMLDESDTANELINKVQQNVAEQTHTRHDLLTYASAKEYIEHNHPKVTFIGFGETDEYAHHDRYDLYLQKAKQADAFIADLWYYVQTDPFYKGNTTLVITTDHGRGRSASRWHKHGPFTKGSGDTWLAMIGPNIRPEGEMKSQKQFYQKQIAQTVASILGFNFKAKHRVSKEIDFRVNDKYDKPVKNINTIAR